MKYFINLILVLTLLSCNAQNTPKQEKNQQDTPEGKIAYKISYTTWEYELPKGYKIREDQFSSAIDAGKDFVEENGQGANATSGDKIIISAAKSDSSDLNALLVIYKNNDMIKQHGLSGYRDKLIEFFKYSFETNGSNFKTEHKDLVIDSKKFVLIENTMFDSNNEYIYSSALIIGEISTKEVSFSLTFNNQLDRSSLMNSILNSKFKI